MFEIALRTDSAASSSLGLAQLAARFEREIHRESLPLDLATLGVPVEEAEPLVQRAVAALALARVEHCQLDPAILDRLAPLLDCSGRDPRDEAARGAHADDAVARGVRSPRRTVTVRV